MGPVLAFTFGTNVRDWGLAKKGFLVEVTKASPSIRFDLLHPVHYFFFFLAFSLIVKKGVFVVIVMPVEESLPRNVKR